MIHEEVWKAMIRMSDLAWGQCYSEEMRQKWREDWYTICQFMLSEHAKRGLLVGIDNPQPGEISDGDHS